MILSGAVATALGATGLVLGGLAYAVADGGGSLGWDYAGPVITLALSSVVVVTGIALLGTGAVRNGNARSRTANEVRIVPTVATTDRGDGILIGASGAF